MVVKPQDIFNALQEAIQIIEKIISKLNKLEGDMKTLEREKNNAKIGATCVNVVACGFSIAAFFLTGGLTTIISATTGAVGFAVNGIVTLVDKVETGNCMLQIQNYLKEFEIVINRLKDLIEKFNQEIEEIMMPNNIDYLTAFRMFMGVEDPTIRLDIFIYAGILACARGRVFTDLAEMLFKNFGTSIAAGEIKLLSNVFGKDIAAIGNAVVGAGSILAPVIPIATALAASILIAYQIVDLIQTITTEHPTLQIIRDTRKSLSEKKSEIQENMDYFVETQANSGRILRKCTKKMLDEEFGGGYLESGDNLTQITYNSFVDQIGTGTMGGFFEIFYLGQMTGRTIELIDGTQERNISMLHGNSKLKFPCFSSQNDSIQLKMTNTGGRNHFNLIQNGRTVEVTPHSDYENCCLYDAVAEALHITTGELLTRLRKFLRNSRAAREAYENGVGEIFDELRGGARDRRRISPTDKVLIIKKSKRQKKGEYVEETYETTVRQENLYQGTDVSLDVRKKIREICEKSKKTEKTKRTEKVQRFDCGHIFAYALGGRGDIIDNVVPMVLGLNRGSYRIMEKTILHILKENIGWHAKLSVTVKRRVVEQGVEEIPYLFVYKCTFYDENGVEQNTIVETFENY